MHNRTKARKREGPSSFQPIAALVLIHTLGVMALPAAHAAEAAGSFSGKYYRGKGDREYLRMLDISRRVFAPDPEFQNLSMLYVTNWNGLVEGPTWDAWWIQNSYGTTYAALPFLLEPFQTFLQNSQDLWFDQMGDGKRAGAPPPFDWVAPDGALCDAARPGWIVYKQGDGRTAIHDWGMEFTAAGMVLQGELLLIERDPDAIHKYLPKLERCARFIESRRNPTNNLFLAGPAGNLLAPSYAGWKKPDGSYGQAYLAGLSITYLAALDRLIELERLAGDRAKVQQYAGLRASAKRGLRTLQTDEGYFIRSLDPDGVKHGVHGTDRHGYFEASPNHDAVAFRIVDDRQAGRIYSKIASLPGLRPHGFILPNFPTYDDMYEKAEGLWAFGTWVNGGHWSTCEARMILGYYRLGKWADAFESIRKWLGFAERFRLDNPLVKCGSDVYQPNQPINLTYDAFGPPAALIRGLFEYLYSADQLTLVPHVPAAIAELDQLFPIRFGAKRLFLATRGQGAIRRVYLNGERWKAHDSTRVFLPYAKTPRVASVIIVLSDYAKTVTEPQATPEQTHVGEAGSEALQGWARRLIDFQRRMHTAGLGESYEAEHCRTALKAIAVIAERKQLLSESKLRPLPPPSQAAADQAYIDAALRLCEGLQRQLESPLPGGRREADRRTIERLAREAGVASQ